MDRKVTLVVLGKYAEVFNPFIQSLRNFRVIDEVDSVVFVRDGEDINLDNFKGPKVTVIQGPEKFEMAGNGNLGMKAVPEENDILYVGDDIRFMMYDTVKKLQEAAYSDDKIGILSPRIIGRGSPTLVSPQPGVSDVRPLEMWFPCIYIKRETINKIGYLDESFNDFGSDDLDFCIRVLLAGSRLCVTSETVIMHQASPEGGPTTFVKNIGVEEWQRQQSDSYSKLRTKYHTTFNAFEQFLATGDVAYLKSESKSEGTDPKEQVKTYEDGLLCRPDEVQDFLKTRHIFLATPAYGGWMSVNYINSCNQLIDLCHQFHIGRTISYMYNESLITRARNKMANDFRRMTQSCPHCQFVFSGKNGDKCSNCTKEVSVPTDFFFIDADIGFDARDIIMLMLRSEDVIGAPCVRKNLRLDRVANAIKKNGREYTSSELETLTGEYVFNFVTDPKAINLGQMIEVKDVGTGLMRVRKETFDKFEAAFPDRWVLPMTGEQGGKVPTYMFFQAGPDEESRKYNPEGLPDYVSEDYHFCREAKKAGMRVWLAPWLKTTHFGSYLFKGDLEAVAKVGGVLR